jgi:hypothetical protein
MIELQWAGPDRVTSGGGDIYIFTTNRRTHVGNQVPGVNENKTTVNATRVMKGWHQLRID